MDHTLYLAMLVIHEAHFDHIYTKVSGKLHK